MKDSSPGTPNLPKKTPLTAYRREILAAGGLSAALLALGFVQKTKAGEALVRPPGGGDEIRFFSQCIKCGKCVAACPENVIVPASIEKGFYEVRTPVMNFHKGFCDYCKKCIESCPTGALLPFEGETCVIGIAELQDECIALRTAGCTKCEEECPYEAITLDSKGSPVIHEDKCTGCGKCVFVCPAHTFQSFTSSKERGITVRAPGAAL